MLAFALLAARAPAQKPLERFPVCEPSAVARVACGEGQTCLLVGDNEQEEDLFLYRVSAVNRTLEPFEGKRFSVRIPEDVSDIEAIAALGPSELLIFGSHGRGRDCDPKGKRRRFLRAGFEGGELDATGDGLVESKKITCSRIFGALKNNDPVIDAVCSAIDKSEEAAEEVTDRLKKTKDERRAVRECSEAAPFNLEGAMTLEKGRAVEVWAGLRSPLVSYGEGAAKAVLLRLSALNGFEFNGATLLDLGGRGIRELSVSGEWVWGIAGPSGAGESPFSLWRFPKAKLVPGVVIRPEIVRSLPGSSEGLVFAGNTLWVLIDGGRGGKSGQCAQQGEVLPITVTQ